MLLVSSALVVILSAGYSAPCPLMITCNFRFSLKADVDHLLDMHIVLQCAYLIMIDNVIRPYQRSQIVKFKKAS
ncbi:hypothetical protein CF017_04320 [Citrobacter braakii]|nr:hypothetical protein CF017_04320 [Citrobacter braakii]